MPEDRMAEALAEAHKYVRELCDLQQELIDKVGMQKMEFVPPPNDGLFERLRERLLRSAQGGQADRRQAGPRRCGRRRQGAGAARIDSRSDGRRALRCSSRSQTAWHDLEEQVVRDLILSGTRPDGRDYKIAAAD